MNWRIARTVGGLFLATGLGGLTKAASHPFILPELREPRALASHAPQRPSSGLVDSAVAAAVAQAPFRKRRSATRPYDVATIGLPASEQVALPKPSVALVGIVWGKVPLAAIEGIPGREGSIVLGNGDTTGGLKLRRISRESVVIAGFDTVWNLRIREHQ